MTIVENTEVFSLFTRTAGPAAVQQDYEKVRSDSFVRGVERENLLVALGHSEAPLDRLHRYFAVQARSWKAAYAQVGKTRVSYFSDGLTTRGDVVFGDGTYDIAVNCGFDSRLRHEKEKRAIAQIELTRNSKSIASVTVRVAMQSDDLLQLGFQCHPAESLSSFHRAIVVGAFRHPHTVDKLTHLIFSPFQYESSNQSKGVDASFFLNPEKQRDYKGLVRGYSSRTAHILLFD